MPQNDANVRSIVKLMYTKFGGDCKYVTLGSTTPSVLLDDGFTRKLEHVLIIYRMVLNHRWKCNFYEGIRDVLTSHEMYIRQTMYACRLEEYRHFHTFERFLSVCTTVFWFCFQTQFMTKVDFNEVVFDIIMVYFEKCLKRKFYKCGGFERLLEYIRHHEYTKWELSKQDCNPFDKMSAAQNGLAEKIQEEEEKQKIGLYIEIDQRKEYNIVSCLALEVLSVTKAQLPSLPTQEDLTEKLRAFEEKKMLVWTEMLNSEEMVEKPIGLEKDLLGLPVLNSNIKLKDDAEQKISNARSDNGPEEITNTQCFSLLPAENLTADLRAFEVKEMQELLENQKLEETGLKPVGFAEDLLGLAILNSDTKLKDDPEQKINNALCNNIVEAVIRYNDFQSSRHTNFSNSIQMQASEILEQLKDTIRSLIYVFDQYDKERVF